MNTDTNNTAGAPDAATTSNDATPRAPKKAPHSDLLLLIPTKVGNVNIDEVSDIVATVSTGKSPAPLLFAVKDLTQVMSSVRASLKRVDAHFDLLCKPKKVLDIPASLEKLEQYYTELPAEVFKGVHKKWLACGVEDTMTLSEVSAITVEALVDMPVAEAKRLLPAVAVARAAVKAGLRPRGIVNDKKVDGEYAVVASKDVSSEAAVVHISNTKNMMLNGHDNKLRTEMNAPNSAYVKVNANTPPRVSRKAMDAIQAAASIRTLLCLDQDSLRVKADRETAMQQRKVVKRTRAVENKKAREERIAAAAKALAEEPVAASPAQSVEEEATTVKVLPKKLAPSKKKARVATA